VLLTAIAVPVAIGAKVVAVVRASSAARATTPANRAGAAIRGAA
jgi:hypothetical protein